MAEEQDYSGYGATGYIPITKWNYVPFYKRYTFTGASQADQAANLITSPSFTKFWSGGGNQTDNISAIHVTSAKRQQDVTALASSGKYNIDATPPVPPKFPTPPEGIRVIDGKTYYNKEGYSLLGNIKEEIPWHLRSENMNRWDIFGGYDYHPDSPYRPKTMQGTYPLLTHEEHNWWKSAMMGGDVDPATGLKKPGYNELSRNYSYSKGRYNSIPLALQNTAGSMVRDDRQLYSTLRYFTDGSGQGVYRGVNASSPSNLGGVSSELSLYNAKGRFSAMNGKRWQSDILYTSSPSAELAMDTRNAQRVLGLGDTYRLNEKAIIEASSYPSEFPSRGPVVETSSPTLDVPEQEPEALVLRKKNIDEARRVGTIRRDTVSGVGADGRPWTDGARTTTMNVYGPPDKYAQWRARGMQALNVGGKVLLGAGIVGETMNTPSRLQQYYMNALKEDPNWRPDISDKIGMSFAAGVENAINFGTMGFYDQRERIFNDMTSGAGYGKGYYGTMTPPAGTTSVHYNPQSRYERTGVSFNHLYPKAP